MNQELSQVELNVFCNYDSSTFSPPLSSIEGFTFSVDVDTAYVNVNGYTQSTSSTWTHAPATIAPSAKGGTWKVITVMIMASDGPAVDRIGVVRLFGLTLKLQSEAAPAPATTGNGRHKNKTRPHRRPRTRATVATRQDQQAPRPQRLERAT